MVLNYVKEEAIFLLSYPQSRNIFYPVAVQISSNSKTLFTVDGALNVKILLINERDEYEQKNNRLSLITHLL